MWNPPEGAVVADALGAAGGQDVALANVPDDVLLSRDQAALALPLATNSLDERIAALRREEPPARRPEEWIAVIAGDPDRVWRASWLAACALHALERSRSEPRV